MAEVEVAALVVNHGSGMSFYWFCWYFRTSRCVPDDCRQVGLHTLKSVHSRCFDFGVSLGILDIVSISPLYSAVFTAGGTLRQVIFWTLDDEEFFVVEGSGRGGVAGSLDSRDDVAASLGTRLRK